MIIIRHSPSDSTTPPQVQATKMPASDPYGLSTQLLSEPFAVVSADQKLAQLEATNMPAYDPYDEYDPSAQLLSEPFADTPPKEEPLSANLGLSHAIPPSDSVASEHARASLFTNDCTDSEEQQSHHQYVEKEPESCPSCLARGRKSHVERVGVCSCDMIGEGTVPMGVGGRNAGKASA